MCAGSGASWFLAQCSFSACLNLLFGQQAGWEDFLALRPPTDRPLSSCAESSPGGHGTQVNVTCIVNVCSSSDHGSQCPSQASPSSSPEDEQVPFSKEECPFRSQSGASETLLQSPEEKPLPLGVPDVGMKPS